MRARPFLARRFHTFDVNLDRALDELQDRGLRLRRSDASESIRNVRAVAVPTLLDHDEILHDRFLWMLACLKMLKSVRSGSSVLSGPAMVTVPRVSEWWDCR